MSWSIGGGSVRVIEEEHYPATVSPGISVHKDLNQRGKKRSLQRLVRNIACHDNLIEEEPFNVAEKKRGLTTEQIDFLETSFNIDVKLEPERKALIAKQLGIRPRQVAIWFQNRRARWKNKQLEQDYEILKARCEAVLKEKESIMKEHDATLKRKKALEDKITYLTSLLPSSESGSISSVVKCGKPELMSPTKSVVEQSEIQEPEHSIPTSSETIKIATADASVEEFDSGFRPEVESPSLESIFDSLPLMVQRLMVNGYSLEDAYDRFFEWEDQFGGLNVSYILSDLSC